MILIEFYKTFILSSFNALVIKMFLLRRGLLSGLFSTAKCTKSPFSQCVKPNRFLFSTSSVSKSDSSEYESVRKAREVDNERRNLVDQDSQLKSENRLLIGFTCKKCSHRTHRTMSHHAYHNGIVLIECSGCQSRHLIADNLGWFKDTPNAARRIEEMTLEVGEIRRSLKLNEEERKGLVELLKD